MNCLWYTEAAKSWIEALPLGNGRLGAMISGEPFCGQIQMNDGLFSLGNNDSG